MEQKLVTAHIGLKFGMVHIEGAKTVAACLAIIESSVTGKPVRPNYAF